MEPTANFSPVVQRLELTNVDVAALQDIGWSVLEEQKSSNPNDYNSDSIVDGRDIDLACSFGEPLDEIFAELGVPFGDLNLDFQVGFADFLVLSVNFGASEALYSQGDLSCDNQVSFLDFLLLSQEFGTQYATAVPEPNSGPLTFALLLLGALSFRKSVRKAGPIA